MGTQLEVTIDGNMAGITNYRDRATFIERTFDCFQVTLTAERYSYRTHPSIL